jgi:hypothetical protein
MTNSTLLKWKCFEYETAGVADDGQPRRRIQQVFKETTATIFLDYMKPKLQNYVKYNFVAKWQDEQCRQMMKNLPTDVIISHIDFAENYSFMI